MYEQSIQEAIEKATMVLCTFGIVPTKPETGGYIERAEITLFPSEKETK
jgi:mannose-1-phosphate guanylyltransferase